MLREANDEIGVKQFRVEINWRGRNRLKKKWIEVIRKDKNKCELDKNMVKKSERYEQLIPLG